MSKVLIDRELLVRLENAYMGGMSIYGECEEIRELLARPAEVEGVGALDELLALFPIKIDKQAFVVNGGKPLAADGDDEFLSFKKVNAALGQIRQLAEQALAALSAVTAERDRLRALVAECAEYLNTDRETTIGSGSILHRQMIAAMAAKEA